MLSEKADKIAKLKYYTDNNERWERLCWRVANHIAKDDKQSTEFFQLIYNKIFIPGGRILANAGTKITNLLNCFVLGIEDSRVSIYQTLKDVAEVFAHGGGCGYNFSNIREEGAKIRTTGGYASGPLSFLTLFDQTGEVIQQASRRGAQIALLDIDHPDIEKYINFKSIPNSRNSRLMEEYQRNLELSKLDRNGKKYFKILEKTLQDDQLTHFNISVLITDEFMKAVEKNFSWGLVSRETGKIVKTVDARKLLRLISEHAWESGDPGLMMYDRVNEDNLVPYLGELKATNPCGEIPLLDGEPCCLGSLNLHSFYDENTNSINLEFLEFAVRKSVRFLDGVVTKTSLPVEKINNMTKGLRRLGLGVFGWADLLAELEIPYDSQDAKDLGEYLSWFISFFAWLESIELAKEFGPFPLYDKDKVNLHVIEKVLNSRFNPHKFNMEQVKEIGVRNVSVTTIPPTGTIAILADMNSGIEPYFALAYKRNITEGVGNTAKDYIIEVNPILFKKLEKYGVENLEEVKDHILEYGTLENCEKIPEKLKRVFKTAMEISPVDHVDNQVSWQKYITNAISKTINLPESATVEDIENILIYGWNQGTKGLTVYRNRSKLFQVLEVGVNNKDKKNESSSNK